MQCSFTVEPVCMCVCCACRVMCVCLNLTFVFSSRTNSQSSVVSSVAFSVSYNKLSVLSHLSQLSPSASRRGERNYSQVIGIHCALWLPCMAICNIVYTFTSQGA